MARSSTDSRMTRNFGLARRWRILRSGAGSSTVTSSPRPSHASERCDPRKPAPPVTRIFTRPRSRARRAADRVSGPRLRGLFGGAGALDPRQQERALPRRDRDPSSGQDLAQRARGRAAPLAREHGAAPQEETMRAVTDERPGVRMGDGADHVGHAPGWPRPLDAPALRTTPLDPAGPRAVLRDAQPSSGQHVRVRLEPEAHA